MTLLATDGWLPWFVGHESGLYRALIFFGSITYSDVFEPTVDHVSGFAYRLTLGEGIHENTTAMCAYQGPASYWHYS